MEVASKNIAVWGSSEFFFPENVCGKAVLDRRDYRLIPEAKAADVWTKIWEWWQRVGFAVAQVGPNHLTGSSVYSKIGLRREVEIRLQEANHALYVDVAFRATLTEGGVVGGAVAAVVFWPIAVAGGAISWSEYESDATALLTNFWHFLWQTTGRPSQILYATTPPFGTPYPIVPPPGGPSARPCTRCGAGLAPDWRACPYCGQLTSPEPSKPSS